MWGGGGGCHYLKNMSGIAFSVVMRCVCKFLFASLSLIQCELITSLSFSSLLLWVGVGVWVCFLGRGVVTCILKTFLSLSSLTNPTTQGEKKGTSTCIP